MGRDRVGVDVESPGESLTAFLTMRGSWMGHPSRATLLQNGEIMRKLFFLTFVTTIVVGVLWLIGKRASPKGLVRAIGGQLGSAEIQARAYPAELVTQEQPQGTAVYARAINSIPGAILCPDQRTVNMMFHLYNSSWEERFRSQLTNG